jgi:hypothetical protein
MGSEPTSPWAPLCLTPFPGEFGSRYRFSRKGEGSPKDQGPGGPFFLGTFSLHPKGTLSLRSGGQAKKEHLGHRDEPRLVTRRVATQNRYNISPWRRPGAT